MERDPILYAWRSAPSLHAWAVGLAVGLGGPLAVFALLCLRDLIGVLTAGDGELRPFLQVVLALPGEAGPSAFTLSPGWSLGPADITLAALVGLTVAALAFAGLGWLIGRLCFSAQARMAGRLRLDVTEAILQAPAGAREDIRALPGLLGPTLSGLRSLPAIGILVPVVTVGAILLALLFAELGAPRLVPVTAVGLIGAALAGALIMRRADARAALRRRESAAAAEALNDLIARMPAVRAHGATAFEQRRLRLRALATRGLLAQAESMLAYARAPALALAILLPAILLAAALWRGEAEAPSFERVAPGAFIAAVAAFVVGVRMVVASLRLWFLREQVAPEFRAIMRILDGLAAQRRDRHQRRAPFPAAGSLTASGVGAFDPASGERVGGIELALPMPSHVAIVGEIGSGGRALAAVLSGQIEPTAGGVAYGGVDLRNIDPPERARRIAFAGGEAILIESTLKQNLLYGARNEDREALDQGRRFALLKVAGLEGFVYGRGLGASIDPGDEPNAAAAVVAARNAVRLALQAEGMARLVEPFDPDLYNHQATIGENLLFGEAVNPAFSQARLASHPYLRAVIEAEDLTRPLIEIGLKVAAATVEIFADLPDDHPLFDAFSLFPAGERGFFEDLVARQTGAKGWRRGPAGQRDRERLIGLALRYSETRHRFGLVDADFEARIVAARHSFAALMPPRFREKVEFYDPARVTAAASLEENLLFGRITQGEAGAEARVRALVRRVLAEQGLEPLVYRLGLATRIEPGAAGRGSGLRASVAEGGVGARERSAIDLVRCLARRPDILIVGHALDGRPPDEIRERITRLRAERAGMGLIVCLPDAASLDGLPPFDAVLTVARSTLTPAISPAAFEPALTV